MMAFRVSGVSGRPCDAAWRTMASTVCWLIAVPLTVAAAGPVGAESAVFAPSFALSHAPSASTDTAVAMRMPDLIAFMWFLELLSRSCRADPDPGLRRILY